jgi:hypothetical protein
MHQLEKGSLNYVCQAPDRKIPPITKLACHCGTLGASRGHARHPFRQMGEHSKKLLAVTELDSVTSVAEAKRIRGK